jgi:hypothetical protein
VNLLVVGRLVFGVDTRHQVIGRARPGPQPLGVAVGPAREGHVTQVWRRPGVRPVPLIDGPGSSLLTGGTPKIEIRAAE